MFGRFAGENTLNPELADNASGVLVTFPAFPAQSHEPVVAERPIAGCKRDNSLSFAWKVTLRSELSLTLVSISPAVPVPFARFRASTRGSLDVRAQATLSQIHPLLRSLRTRELRTARSGRFVTSSDSSNSDCLPQAVCSPH